MDGMSPRDHRHLACTDKSIMKRESSSSLTRIRLPNEALNALGKQPGQAAVVVSLPTTESTYVTVNGRGPQGWAHPDYAPLYVATQVLNGDESFLWVSDRYMARGRRCNVDRLTLAELD